MKLYYSKGACSFAIRIIINEIGIPCEYEAVNLASKITEQGTNFLKINPKGAVPTLVLDSQEILTENAVIQQYLADTHGAKKLLPLLGDFTRYRVLEWLNFISTDLHKGFGPLFNQQVSEEVKKNIFIPILKSKLNIADGVLHKNKYLLGDEFTLPDGYLFVILSWLPKVGIELSDWPNLSRYFSEVKKRKSVQQSFEEERKLE